MEIKNLKPRVYQETIFNTATKNNTLVTLPTGLGKTIIALMLAVYRIKKHPNKKILFMAPTKPLCNQHKETFSKYIDEKEKLELITGEINPDERQKHYKNKIIFATPQTIANDIINRRLNLEDFSLIIFDEAHRTVGNYDYVFIAKQFFSESKEARILALTASPGSNKKAIKEICENLYIDKIEHRDETSPDVKKYIKEKNIERVMITLPEEIKEIKKMLENVLKRRLKILKKNKIIKSSDIEKVRKSQLIRTQSSFARKARGNWFLMKNISVIAACIKTMHCLELLQTQGIKPLFDFFLKLKKQARKTKASKSLIQDVEFKEAMQRTNRLKIKQIEHPKFEKLVSLVEKENQENSKTIIFTQYRNTADRILEYLKRIKNIHPVKFIGQRSGMSQKEQIETLKEFKNGVYNVLVCTSIGEEGLHIENADLGIFFEPVPSALRTIQRRGRIGRVNIGKIVTLITKNTIDEKYYWISFHKERRMKDSIEKMQEEIEGPQKRIKRFVK